MQRKTLKTEAFAAGITGRFPNGEDACNASTTCVSDVFPGCTNYRGDSDSPWAGPVHFFLSFFSSACLGKIGIVRMNT